MWRIPGTKPSVIGQLTGETVTELPVLRAEMNRTPGGILPREAQTAHRVERWATWLELEITPTATANTQSLRPRVDTAGKIDSGHRSI